MERKAELQTRATMLEQQVQRSKTMVQSAQAKIGQLNQLAARLTLQNQNAATINGDLGKDNIAKTREIEALKQTDTDLQADIGKLQKTKSDLATQISTLQASYDGVNSAYHKLIDANAEASRSLDAQIADLKRERDDVARQRDQLYNEIAGNNHDFAQTYLALRGTKLALRAGGELARLTIASHERPERVKADLNTLLDRAASKASQFGATRGENGREVTIVTKHFLTSNGTANEDTSIATFTTDLTARDYPTTVIAYVCYNSLAGEPALIDLNLVKIVPVYAAGEMVATRHFDVRRSTDDIFADILGFLQQEVRDAAIRKGILPQIDPRTGIPEVGVISYSELFRVTEQVRRMGGTVKISALARHALTSADALDVELGVQNAFPNPARRTRPLIPCVLAIDPGSAKCGLAIVQQDGVVRLQAVVPTGSVVAHAQQLTVAHRPVAIVIGNGTGSKPLLLELQAAGLPAPLLPMDESYTSQAARVRYLTANPPRGWQRLLPISLRTPPSPTTTMSPLSSPSATGRTLPFTRGISPNRRIDRCRC